MRFLFDKEIILENNRVLLRSVTELDVEQLLLIATWNKNLLQFSPGPVYTKELLEKQVDRVIQNSRRKQDMLLAYSTESNAAIPEIPV